MSCETKVKKKTCPATYDGHRCELDEGDLHHFPKQWGDTQPWLLGVSHRCGCDDPTEWPEVL